MNILYVVFNIRGEGTYLRAFELARAISGFGHSLTILASSNDVRTKTKYSIRNGIQVIEASNLFKGSIRAGWDIGNVLTRINAIKPFDYDLVHGFESRPSVIYPALSIKKKGVPLFLDWADWFGSGGSIEERPSRIFRNVFRPLETYYERQFRSTPLGTSVICKTLKNRAINMGVLEEDICLLPNGFNVLDWQPISINEARSKLSLAHGKLLIGYLGSLFPNDANLLSQTLSLLKDYSQNFQVLHVGKSNYQIDQNQGSAELILETGAVDFQGMQTYLSACDVLLLPFKNSPANSGRFPLKFSNYLACGRPIVATNVGDIPYYINKHKLGIVTEDNPVSIVRAIIQLQNDPDMRLTYGQSALELSNGPKESWSSRAKLLMDFYIEKIEGKFDQQQSS